MLRGASLTPGLLSSVEQVMGGVGGPYPKMVLFGDSFSARNTTVGSPCRDLDWGYFTWAQALMGAPFRLIYNAGVAGNTTTQMLARISSDVLSKSPDWVIVQGGINDITAAVSDATICSNLKTICSTLVNSGINVILLTIAPNNQSAGNSLHVQTVNQTMREWCRNTARGVIFVDTYQYLVDPTVTTGAFASGMSDDSLHLSGKGARAAGQAIANSIQYMFPNKSYLPSSNGEDYGVSSSSLQIVSNPMMTGTGPLATGTGASGNVPTSWAGSTSGFGAGTAVFTPAVARSDGIGNDTSIVVASAPSGASVNIRQTGLVGRAAIGDYLYVVGQVKITGATDIKNVNIGGSATIDGTTYQVNCLEASGTTNYSQSDMTLTFRSEELPLTGSSITAITLTASVTFGTTGTGAATIKFGRIGMYKQSTL